MVPLVVVGAGGHGKVVADILRAANETVFGFVDDGELPPEGTLVAGLPIVGPTEWIRTNPCRIALGIGDNVTRSRVAKYCVEQNRQLIAAIHPRAVISASARIAEGAVVMALAVVNPDAVIHRGAIVNTGVIVEHDCIIEAFAHLSPNATLGGGCRVGELAHLGIGATMLPRTSLGARSTVGGGGVVARDIPDGVIAMGVPARVTRSAAVAPAVKS